MPRVNVRRSHIEIPSRYKLLVMSVLCIILMIVTYFTDVISTPLGIVSGYTIVPFQNGIQQIGSTLTSKSDDLKKLREVTEENNRLQEELDRLKIENSNLVQDKYELNELRELYQLDQKYADYKKVGARVIAKDSGNWFSVFTINKGKNQGIQKDMNVMAGSGLVGIVTNVGPNWATVRSIIDDNSNVSGTILSTSDHLVITGDLELMKNGKIRFSQLIDEENQVIEGDQIVTSDISDKFLPGINIGYVDSVEVDSNELTKSGTIIPTVDFEHLDLVLVVMELKDSVEKED